MTELRWNPTAREWVSTASHRQERPQLPTEWCPFCPGSGRVPDRYDVHIYPNDFPAFSIPPPEPAIEGDAFYRVARSHGRADVVLYHPDHNTSLPELSLSHLLLLVRLWRKRFVELSYRRAHRRCVFCEVLKRERRDGRRMVAENEGFTAFSPFFARWPYEVHVYPRRHFGSLDEFRPQDETAFAEILKWVTMKYDNLYGFSFPYMMLIHQAPTAGRFPYFHFHVEFYPPHRSRDKLKYLASVETGAGTFLNDSLAEEKAKELAAVAPRQRADVRRRAPTAPRPPRGAAGRD